MPCAKRTLREQAGSLDGSRYNGRVPPQRAASAIKNARKLGFRTIPQAQRAVFQSNPKGFFFLCQDLRKMTKNEPQRTQRTQRNKRRERVFA
jgi:hypothetical protein